MKTDATEVFVMFAFCVCFLFALIVCSMIDERITSSEARGVGSQTAPLDNLTDGTTGTDAYFTFGELLDAIEWVESKGDANAVGDFKYFNTWDDANEWRSLYSSIEDDCIYIDLGGMVFDENSEEIIIEDIQTVPGGMIKIYIPQAIGAFQIHKIYVDDINRIMKLYTKKWQSWVDAAPEGEVRKAAPVEIDGVAYYQFTYEDRWDKVKSRAMTSIYIWYYGKDKDFESMARIHNGGPDGWRNDPQWFVRNRNYTLAKAKKKIENAKAYWLKVKERLKKVR